MRSYEIDEDIRSTLYSIHKVRAGEQDHDESFLTGRMFAIIDYSTSYFEETFGGYLSYDYTTNTVLDERGRVIYNCDGRTYVEEDDEAEQVEA